MQQLIDVHSDVAVALRDGKPVVALESSLITNGFAPPVNLDIAREQEQILSDMGVQPATTAIINGRLKAGVTNSELEYLASGASTLQKASRRDLACLQAAGLSGGTTVAAAMLIASLSGIRILSTGGIGGVHRYAGHTFDISADLVELGRTPVAVVCSGAKSILDVPKTLEYLETMGVPVLGYQTSSVPVFYSSSSSRTVDYRLENDKHAAAVIEHQRAMQLESGLLICNPIPEAFAISELVLNPIVDQAIVLAEQQGISGKAVTPFLLKELHKNTELNLLDANVALLKNNARVAAEIALQLSCPSL